MSGPLPRRLRVLGALFPDTEAGLSAYGDLVEEYEALRKEPTPYRLPRSARFWVRAVGLAVGYGLWSRLRRRRGRGTAQRRSSWVRWMLQDVRLALRGLVKEPAFSLVAILSVAVGIGATTGAVSLANTLLIRPLPGITGHDRVVEVGRTRDGGGFDTFSYPDYEDLQALGDPLESVAAWHFQEMSLSGSDEGERVFGMAVSASYFDVLGARPVQGRGFLPGEDVGAGEHPLVVISHGFWTGRLGSDPRAVGSTLHLNRTAFTVVGITAPGFKGHVAGYPAAFWIPVTQGGRVLSTPAVLEQRGSSWLQVLGRLSPGATVPQTRAAVHTLFVRLAEAYPETNARRGAGVMALGPLPGGGRGFVAGFITMLTALVVLILLAACANVAGMLMARAAATESVTAIRVALGAGRARIVGNHLIQTLLLFGAGGALGTVAAYRAVDSVDLSSLPVPIPVELDFAPDPWILLAGASLTLVTALVFAMAPAVQSTRVPPMAALGRRLGSGRPGRVGRVRKFFVGAQVSVAVLILVSAGLFLRSLRAAAATDPGFRSEGVAVTTLDLSLEGVENDESGIALQGQLLDHLASTPGIRSAALASDLPLDLGRSGTGVIPEGADPASPDASVGVDFNLVSPGYFETLGIELLQGRRFDSRDGSASPPVLIVSRHFAESVLPGEPVLGAQFRFGRRDAPLATIVGVVENAKNTQISEADEPMVYAPLSQNYSARVHVLARFDSGRDDGPGALGTAIRAFDSRLSQTPALHLGAYTSIGTLPQRLAGGISTSLGVIGLLLASMGIYGIVAYGVSRRRKEIGLRMALGAGGPRVRREVVQWGMRLVIPGTLAALPLAGLLGLAIRGFLIDIGPMDPWAFASALLLVAAVAGIAALIPAVRASRVDPNVALQSE